jgi:hypothetical protein
VTYPGSSYCKNCKNQRAKENRLQRIHAEREWRESHNEYGDLIGPDGYTDRQREDFIAMELERMANDPKFDPNS